MLEFKSSSLTILPLKTAIAAIEDVELECASVCEAANARIAGNISGLAPAITALMATVSTVYCPRLPFSGDPHLSDDFIGLVMGCLEHRRHPLFGRHDDRKLVGPETLIKVLLDVLGGVRSDEALFLTLDDACLFLLIIQRPRQIVHDFLHERLLGDRIVTRNVCVQLFPRLSAHWRMSEDQPESRHAFFIGLVVNQIDQSIDDDSYRRDPVIRLNFRYMADDRRRAGASMANGHDHQAVDGLDFLPQIRVIGGIRAFLLPEYRF